MPISKQPKHRPSRKGVYITPYKGGRTVRKLAPMTPAIAERLEKHLKGKGISFGDFVEEMVKHETKYMEW